jgi:predicted chitinase
MVTDDELRQIMPNLPQAKRALFLPHLQAAMSEFGITTMLREAAFLAQIAHESAQLRFMEEIWGPTSAQRRYEPVTNLSKMLGNTQAGDGKRFKGRGPIQLTGRSNYKTFGDKLGLNLVANPAIAATPEVAFRIAGLFWQSRGLNPLADVQNFREITRRINGGFNGLADREMFYERAKRVLSSGDAAPAQRSAPPPPPPAGASAPKSAAKRGIAPGGETDTGLSRGILPGDPATAKLLRADGGAAKKSAAKSAKKSAKKSATKKSAKKSSTKKSAKKSPAKKGGAKKSAAGKSSAKKSSSKKSSAKKGAGKGGGGKKGGGGGGGGAAKRSATTRSIGSRGFK